MAFIPIFQKAYMKIFGYLTIVVILLGASCRKIDVLPLDTCEPIPPGPDIGWNYAIDSFSVSGASFNPNNQDEFAFVHNPGNSNPLSLVKYNMLSRQKTILFEGNIIYTPSWGANGWILISLIGGQIYKITDSGENLTQLTNSGSNWQPKWNPDATKFAYYSNPTGRGYTYICNPDGVATDTLRNSGIGMSWNHPRYSPSAGGLNVNISDMSNDSLIIVADAPAGGSSGTGAIFTDPNNLVYAYKTGIYSTNIQTHETRQLKTLCNSITYLQPDYSDHRQQIIWVRQTYEAISPLYLLVRSRFVLTDADGQNEEMIDVEW